MAVVSYDDLEVAQQVGLSTVCQLMFQMGQEGTQLLLAMLSDRAAESPR